MDRKVSALEAELKAISAETKTSSKLLKTVNAMASKMVHEYKCILKSKAKEKLQTYMQITKNLADIKAHMVAENVKLESFLISLGYVEDEDSEYSDDEDSFAVTKLPVDASVNSDTAVMSSESELQEHFKTNVTDSVILDPMTYANTVVLNPIHIAANIENITTEHLKEPEIVIPHIERILTYIESVASSNVLTENIHLPIPTCTEENLKIFQTEVKTEAICPTIPDQATNSSIKKADELDAEEILNQKHLVSFEKKHLISLLEKSYEPNLRLQRSSSSSSILSSSTNSSSKIDTTIKPKASEFIPPLNVTDTEIDLQNVKQHSTLSLETITKVNSEKLSIKDVSALDISSEDINRKFLKPRFPKVQELCIISSCKNPQNLYIQLYEQCDSLLTLYDHLNAAYEHCTLRYTIKINAKENIGDCCTAYLEDYNGWHRVQVLDWQLMSHTNTVLVFVVDYGDTLKVPVENLRKLMSEFFEYPMFAINCSLEHVYPPSSSDKSINTIWTTTELNAFYEFMQKGNQITYKLTYVNAERNPIGIDLVDIEDVNPENSLGQELINANVVKQILFVEAVKPIPDNSIMLEQIKSVQGLYGTDKSMTENERLEKYLENDLYGEPRNIVEAITGYDANDERRVCKFTRPDGTCFKGLNCKMEHIQLRADGFTTDKNFVYHNALHNTILPTEEEEIKIYITCITRPYEFYGHIQERNELKIYGTSLQQLALDLKNPKVMKQLKCLSMLPSIGQIVLAKNWDNSWCRAKVIHIDGLAIDVFIVDYGETVTVNKDDLREISRDYLVLPFQAVKFSLWDIENIPDHSDEEIITHMETHYLCDEFSAKVRACRPLLYVEVYLRRDVDMGEDLISRGFARRPCGKQLIIETTLVD